MLVGGVAFRVYFLSTRDEKMFYAALISFSSVKVFNKSQRLEGNTRIE